MKPNDLLKKHITLVYSKSNQHKTILITSPILYIVVTRVNYLVQNLWIEYINELIAKRKDLQIEPIKKLNWLVQIKSYRRELEIKLKT